MFYISMDTWTGVFFGAIISILVGYIFYKINIKEKKLIWSIRSNNLIQDYSNTYNDISIRYKDEQVRNLSISKIIIWNNGREAIKKEDFTKNKLRITCKEGIEIFDPITIARTSDSIEFSVILSEDKKNAFIDFKYLNEKDGAVIQFFHTGLSSADIRLEGEIIDAKKIINMQVPVKFPNLWSNLSNILIIVIFMFIYFYGLTFGLSHIQNETTASIIKVIYVLTLTGSGLALSNKIDFLLKNLRIPKGLAIFKQE